MQPPEQIDPRGRAEPDLPDITEPQGSVKALKMPALFLHCQRVYETMDAQARPAMVEGDFVNMYEGYTTKLCQSLGLATPHYTAVFDRLKTMGCVIQYKRGGGGQKSQWMLMWPPTVELWEKHNLKGMGNAVAHKQRDALQQQVMDLNARVGKLEQAVDLLLSALKSKDQVTNGNSDMGTGK
jgi:hypothetical protein